MDRELIELLAANRTNATVERRGWRCADETRLAAYADGLLDPATRKALEEHLVDCHHCLDQVSFLVRSHEWSEFDEFPATLKARAKSLFPAKSKSRFVIDWRWATAALATCLVLAALLVIATRARRSNAVDANLAGAQLPNSPASPSAHPNPSRNPDLVAIDKSPSVRPAPSHSNKPASIPLVRKNAVDSLELLAPRERAVLKRKSIEVSWQTLPEVVFYEVSVKDSAGEIVITKQTEASRLSLPPDIRLKPATKYFISVNARLRDGRMVRSSIVSFTVH